MLAEHRILVTGATGNTGSMVLPAVAGRGTRVRARVREQCDGERLRVTSADVVVGNFDDPVQIAMANRLRCAGPCAALLVLLFATTSEAAARHLLLLQSLERGNLTLDSFTSSFRVA